jgi:hypothetical protein
LPFTYPDGDMIEIFISYDGGENIRVTDMGLTVMKLSYEFDLNSNNKKKIFKEIISNYEIQEDDGLLFIDTNTNDIFPCLMHFIEVAIKVSDLNFLKRETVKSMFLEYFETFVEEELIQFNPVKDYYPPFDTEKQYPSPYAFLRENNSPICVFPIHTDEKCNEATIVIQQYELGQENFEFDSIAVFENQEVISRKPLARLSNVVGKQFASLNGNQERIKGYCEKELILA